MPVLMREVMEVMTVESRPSDDGSEEAKKGL